ncbi:uncharacterized protein LOC111282869 isoform X3 [Durio zibethinus]|uniref:Uncharacterized protein LOC111282869 isoform X3 n=1 Tax=Durio zibethinus TaxID=66656 RepID=A0A6P5XEW1_DURZI|nr:uncharacterized protein LOC111282869 isoform X3 [Durio zibethinus]
MSADLLSERPLFGGAISTAFPIRFQDVSNIRQVPDHQITSMKLEMMGVLFGFFETLPVNKTVKDSRFLSSQKWLRPLDCVTETFRLLLQLQLAKWYESYRRLFLRDGKEEKRKILSSPLSESASTVGAGLAIPAIQSGFMPMFEVFKLAVTSFKVNDWGLFGPTV